VRHVSLDKRRIEIDILKGLAILSVICLHSLSYSELLLIAAPFHIWQAVPVFIILAAYNNTQSYERMPGQSLLRGYQWTFLSKRLSRLLMPFVIVWIGQILIIVLRTDIDLKMIFLSFISGGWGPGNYFIPVIVQQLFFLPILYWLTVKWKTKAVWLVFVLSMTFEVVSYLLGTPFSVYRLLYFRFLFASILGVWIAVYGVKLKPWILLSIVSLMYIAGFYYFGYHLPIETQTGSQNAPSFFYPLLLTVLGLLYLKGKTGFIWDVIAEIGQASYYIFLAQMAYFWIAKSIVNDLPYFMTPISIVICCLCGYLFYKIENSIRAKFS